MASASSLCLAAAAASAVPRAPSHHRRRHRLDRPSFSSQQFAKTIGLVVVIFTLSANSLTSHARVGSGANPDSKEETLDQVDHEDGIDVGTAGDGAAAPVKAPDGIVPPLDGSGRIDGDKTIVYSKAEMEGLHFMTKPTLTPRSKPRYNRLYYCHHHDSCGSRLYPGPASVDSLNDGVNCYCRGNKNRRTKYFCFVGRCYDPAKSVHREPYELDNDGLCEFDEQVPAPIENCMRKPREAADPYLRYFTDPPLLTSTERH